MSDADQGAGVEDEISGIKRELEEIELSKAAIFRSKCNWSQQGERPTKYFLGLEKRNFTNKLIKQLRGDDGAIISGQKNILEAQKRFFTKIYTEDRSGLDHLDDTCPFLLKEDLLTLTGGQRNIIDRPLTKQEFFNG